jgi:hypothetical protein
MEVSARLAIKLKVQLQDTPMQIRAEAAHDRGIERLNDRLAFRRLPTFAR